jgi:hypothetical protein
MATAMPPPRRHRSIGDNLRVARGIGAGGMTDRIHRKLTYVDRNVPERVAMDG